MIELVSGMPAPQFGERMFVSARIRAGSRFKRFLCSVLIDVRCFSYSLTRLRVPSRVRIPQVEDHSAK
jgi:hypothetical protein